MRLATVDVDGDVVSAAVVGDDVYPLPDGIDVLTALAMTTAERAELALAAFDRMPYGTAEYRLLPPVEPRALRDFVAFEEHVAGVSRSVNGAGDVPEAWYEKPAFLFMNPHSVIGAHDEVPVPPGCEALDFELEIAAVVARPCRDLTPAQAAEHIAGYCVLNDWSARDLQRREMEVGLGPSKGKDFATTLGPWITTADELVDQHTGGLLDLVMTVEVNGREVGRDRSGHMAWSFAELLAHASRGAWVGAGDVIASGTCHTGALAETWGRTGRQDPPPLRPGDVVTMTVEELGSVRNTVVPTISPAWPVPPARRGAGVAGVQR